MHKILIADDHAMVRQGLKQTLADGLGEVQFGEATSAQEAIELVWKQNWDAVVLDINMPGRSGLDALKEIKGHRPQLPVLILSVHTEDQYAIRVLKAGAAGYLMKDAAAHELVNAVKKISAGGCYVSAALAERLASALKTDAGKEPHETLSDREYQIMRLLAGGKTVSQIATELSLSVKTISTHRTRILEKMNLKNNAELMKYAVDHRLL